MVYHISLLLEKPAAGSLIHFSQPDTNTSQLAQNL